MERPRRRAGAPNGPRESLPLPVPSEDFVQRHPVSSEEGRADLGLVGGGGVLRCPKNALPPRPLGAGFRLGRGGPASSALRSPALIPTPEAAAFKERETWK